MAYFISKSGCELSSFLLRGDMQVSMLGGHFTEWVLSRGRKEMGTQV